MASLFWSTTKRGGKMLIYQSYMYHLDKKTGDMSSWRCKTRKCPGRVLIKEPEEIVSQKDHNHEINEVEVQTHLNNEKIKKSAKTSSSRSSSIVTVITAATSDDIVCVLPSRKVLMNTVNRVRNREIDDFKPTQQDIPPSLHKNPRGELFMRYDSGIDNDNRVVFFFQIYN